MRVVGFEKIVGLLLQIQITLHYQVKFFTHQWSTTKLIDTIIIIIG